LKRWRALREKILRWGFLCILPALGLLFLTTSLLPANEGTPPKPRRKIVRHPAVAGYFYPLEPQTLKMDVRTHLKTAKKNKLPGRIMGLVAPHAGYVYSGIVAGAGYRLLDKNIKKVIVIAASHHHRFNGISIPDVDAYRTPLGDIPLAREAHLLRSLKSVTYSPEGKKEDPNALHLKIGYVPEAHNREHSLEVQLPFLQEALEDFELVPIVCGLVNADLLAALISRIMGRETLVIASSDLSHYKAYEETNKLDKVTVDAITNLKFSKMDACEACGKIPVLTLMKLAQAKGWEGHTLDYRNSGDTSGKKDRVVGYTAIAFTRPKGGITMDTKTTKKDQEQLLKLARSAIRSKLIAGEKIDRPKTPSPLLKENRGCFVTLHDDSGNLRGCIGNLEPVRPLMEGIEENAKNAAFDDPRFSSLTREELEKVGIEVSVLTVPRTLDYDGPGDLLKKLRPGVHGVILSKGMRRATYLPQVWDQIPSKEMFLISLCKKAGLTPNAWKDPDTEILVYEAEYFEEEKKR